MMALGLAAPNPIRCQRAAVARPCGGSLRPRGLVVDMKVCATCGAPFSRGSDRPSRWAERRYCSPGCCRARGVDSAERRLDRYTRKGPECWEWTGRRDKDGYGHIRRFRLPDVRAHRAAWELHFGPIPAGMMVCHHCDNPPCVKTEPDELYPEGHLFLGMSLHNNADRHHKGRSAGGSQPGVSNPAARLTEADVRRLRLESSGGSSHRRLARSSIERRGAMSTEDLRQLVAFLLREMERNAGYTDGRQRDSALLFGALFGVALRAGAVLDGDKLRERR
jgi:hypothetical protein